MKDSSHQEFHWNFCEIYLVRYFRYGNNSLRRIDGGTKIFIEVNYNLLRPSSPGSNNRFPVSIGPSGRSTVAAPFTELWLFL